MRQEKRDNPINFTESRLILCEGNSDAAFFDALIRARSLPRANVRTVGDLTSSPGDGQFGAALQAAAPLIGFGGLKDIVIVIDCDENAGAALEKISKQIQELPPMDEDTGLRFPVPNKLLQKEVGEKNGDIVAPSIVVLPVPGLNQRGALESLCYQAAVREKPEKSFCVDGLVSCAGVSHWSSSKLAKARLRAFLAIANEKDPDLALSLLWKRAPEMVPLRDPCFDEISNFLRDL